MNNVLSSNSVKSREFNAGAQAKLQALTSLLGTTGSAKSPFMDTLTQECQSTEWKKAPVIEASTAKEPEIHARQESYNPHQGYEKRDYVEEKPAENKQSNSAAQETQGKTETADTRHLNEKAEKPKNDKQAEETPKAELLGNQAAAKEANHDKHQANTAATDKKSEEASKQPVTNGKEALLLKLSHDDSETQKAVKSDEKNAKKSASDKSKVKTVQQTQQEQTQQQNPEGQVKQAAQATANAVANKLVSTKHAGSEEIEEKAEANKRQKSQTKTQQIQNTQQDTQAAQAATSAKVQTAAKQKAANVERDNDIVSRLEKESGVKISKLTIENTPAEAGVKTESAKGLLNSLLAHARINPAIEKHAADASDTHTGKQQQQEQNSGKNKVQEAVQSLADKTLSALGKNSAQQQEQRLGPLNTSGMDIGFDKFSQMSAVRTGAAQQPQASQSAQSVQVIQELVAKMQPMLRGAGIEGGSKLSMDFQTQTLGQFHLSLQQKGDTLMVSLQAQTDSSRDQMMQQRDELSRQLQNFGFKNVSVDITSDSTAEQQKNAAQDNAARWRFRGNDLAENVKLGGNDHADLSQILNM